MARSEEWHKNWKRLKEYWDTCGGLSNHLAGLLATAGIENLGALSNMTESEVLQIQGIGKPQLRRIKELLNSRKLSLSEPSLSDEESAKFYQKYDNSKPKLCKYCSHLRYRTAKEIPYCKIGNFRLELEATCEKYKIAYKNQSHALLL